MITPLTLAEAHTKLVAMAQKTGWVLSGDWTSAEELAIAFEVIVLDASRDVPACGEEAYGEARQIVHSLLNQLAILARVQPKREETIAWLRRAIALQVNVGGCLNAALDELEPPVAAYAARVDRETVERLKRLQLGKETEP